MRRTGLVWALGGILSGLGLLAGFAFHDRYWLRRDCFNEIGRCWDPASQTVYVEQSGMVWGGLASLFLISGVALLWLGGDRR